MTEQNREQISALVDGELASDTSFTLNSLKNHPEHRKAWHRYHLIGECLRGNLPLFMDKDLAERIKQAIDKEPAIISPRSSYLPRILKPVAGFAIAASITVVAILGIRQTGITPVATSTQSIAQNVTDSQIKTSKPQIVTVTSTTENKPTVPQFHNIPLDAESRLNRYLVNYNEYRTNAGVQGMLPYVRIIAHEKRE